LMVRSGGEGAPELGEDGINSAARGLKVLAVRAMPFEGATREESSSVLATSGHWHDKELREDVCTYIDERTLDFTWEWAVTARDGT
jgi:hypothetical protein